MFDYTKTEYRDIFNNTKYPHEVLLKIKDYIIEFIDKIDKTEYIEIDKNVFAKPTAKIDKTVKIEPYTIIGDNTEIRYCAYIRGYALIGNNCVIGNSSELKNSILFDEAKMPHFNYVGDSILGFKAHIGAGVKISNLKSDESFVNIIYENMKIETNMRKIGAIIGDNVEVGCNSVLNPGTVIGANTTIYPLSNVRGYVKSNSIYKAHNNIINKI